MTGQKGKKADEGKQEWLALPLVVLQPLLDVFKAGEGHYGLFNCLKPFDDANRRFYNAQMRHVSASQIDPLAIDPQDDCLHQAKVAFNALMRIYHCRKESPLKNILDASDPANMIKDCRCETWTPPHVHPDLKKLVQDKKAKALSALV